MTLALILVAASPLFAALAAVLVVYLTGFDQNLNLPTQVESRFYGFFLDRYPLFAFALVYGLARIVCVALAPGPSGLARRTLGGLVGLVLLLGVSLHPTFGGMVLRGGFATGGMAFLNSVPMPFAYLLGAAVAAGTFGLALGAGVLLVGRGWRDPVGRWRGLARNLSGIVSRYLVLWYGFAVLGLARSVGFGAWPHRPMDLGDTLLASACLVLGLLPHALLVAGRIDPAPKRDPAPAQASRRATS